MSSSIDLEKLAIFLVIAKIVTYASGNDEIFVLPVLANSYQLEYLDEPLFYRDIYCGGLHFIGMESVFLTEEPFWGDELQRRHSPRQ